MAKVNTKSVEKSQPLMKKTKKPVPQSGTALNAVKGVQKKSASKVPKKVEQLKAAGNSFKKASDLLKGTLTDVSEKIKNTQGKSPLKKGKRNRRRKNKVPSQSENADKNNTTETSPALLDSAKEGSKSVQKTPKSPKKGKKKANPESRMPVPSEAALLNAAKQRIQRMQKKAPKKAKNDGDKKNNRKNKRGVVYLGHIPEGFFETEMKGFFSQFGVVTRVKVSRSSKTGRSKGYGFVEFSHNEVAKIVAETMNNYLMFERLVKAQYIPPEKVSPGMFPKRFITEDNYPTLNRRNSLKARQAKMATEKDKDKHLGRIHFRIKQAVTKLKDMGIEYTPQVYYRPDLDTPLTTVETAMEVSTEVSDPVPADTTESMSEEIPQLVPLVTEETGAKPMTVEPSVPSTQPEKMEPDQPESAVSESAVQPETAESVSVIPESEEPKSVVQPKPAQPESVAKPETIEETVAQPEPVEPESVAQPEPTEPESVAQPEPTESESAAQPETAEPEPAAVPMTPKNAKTNSKPATGKKRANPTPAPVPASPALDTTPEQPRRITRARSARKPAK